MQTVTIKGVNRKAKTSAKGKDFISIGILTEELDGWYNGFADDVNKNWEKGDVVAIETQITKEGFKNFRAGSTQPANTKVSTPDDTKSDIRRGNAVHGASRIVASLKDTQKTQDTFKEWFDFIYDLERNEKVDSIINDVEEKTDDIPF